MKAEPGQLAKGERKGTLGRTITQVKVSCLEGKMFSKVGNNWKAKISSLMYQQPNPIPPPNETHTVCYGWELFYLPPGSLSACQCISLDTCQLFCCCKSEKRQGTCWGWHFSVFYQYWDPLLSTFEMPLLSPLPQSSPSCPQNAPTATLPSQAWHPIANAAYVGPLAVYAHAPKLNCSVHLLQYSCDTNGDRPGAPPPQEGQKIEL